MVLKNSHTLLVSENLTLNQQVYSRPNGSGRRSSENVSSTGVLLLASPDLALPDTDVGPPDRGLSTGGTRVPRVLSDFHLLDAEIYIGGKSVAISISNSFSMMGTHVFLKEAP
jgi:hypothetical protein